VLDVAPVGETAVVWSNSSPAGFFFMVCWLPWALFLLGMRRRDRRRRSTFGR
jgi:hypothetical protein